MKKFTYLVLLTLLSASLHAESITFGVVPQHSASKLAKQWAPIIEYLSERTGQKIIFSTASDIPTFEQRLKNGEYDLAYMNPYHYTVFSELPGYKAIAKAKDKRLKGIIVVRKDSDISKPEQLQNTELAFPSPAAFAATVLTQAYLKQSNITFEPSYVSSHDSVYLAVAKGFFPAGGGIIRTYMALPEETRDQLTPIWTTKGYTPHAIAAHPNLNSNVKSIIQQALIEFDDSPEGLAHLEKLKLKGFISAQDSDWNDVRALNITLLD
ncbi:phosphate/phosphite/phosphonate ABC transporter substrate-binding protein [Vibrio coralliilyticus]|uniref:phosphate/phosphite/phosphonate ABC transporter substrate-binding protein n=1 Tax=Vibrio coralliilyticus TaxID=190893 RepID=UPI0006CC5054|nr:phosphate/phosphite/phosphonate ABC transporter substrate-binding protein [Vibrio coralliilyticus]AXN30568.1 phosphate/phosphite/phosphonate ABC transporter substrate-binding protein [Vibrio coralliilyticus]KPH26954.1 phosphate ABC transporter substrate-binding protein [Vibrio coralliilyticus]